LVIGRDPQGRQANVTSVRDQILADLTAQVLTEATRTVVRLENDGVDGNEAIRMVHAALADVAITETELAQGLNLERRRSDVEDAPDARELGGQG
jgi:hypothetical protein